MIQISTLVYELRNNSARVSSTFLGFQSGNSLLSSSLMLSETNPPLVSQSHNRYDMISSGFFFNASSNTARGLRVISTFLPRRVVAISATSLNDYENAQCQLRIMGLLNADTYESITFDPEGTPLEFFAWKRSQYVGDVRCNVRPRGEGYELFSGAFDINISPIDIEAKHFADRPTKVKKPISRHPSPRKKNANVPNQDKICEKSRIEHGIRQAKFS